MTLKISATRRVFAVACAVLSALASQATGAARVPETSGTPNLPLRQVAEVPLGGNTTRFDYESFDATRHLLFIAHLGDSQVIVFDTRTSQVVGRVEGVASVHGVLAIPELGRVYATATGTQEVVAIDMATMTITARLPTGAFPNGMAYAPDAHKLYVSDQRAGALMVVDTRSNTTVATIPLGGDVGNTQYDPVSKHVFVNIQTQGRLAEIDPATDKVVALIDVPGAQRNHGLLVTRMTGLHSLPIRITTRLLPSTCAQCGPYRRSVWAVALTSLPMIRASICCTSRENQGCSHCSGSRMVW